MRKSWYTYLYVRSPIAKIAWGIAAVLISLVAILLAGVLEESRMEAQTQNWDGRSIEKGADLFANNCASCHGLDGQGGAGPALHSRYFFTQRLADLGYAGTLHDYVELTVAAGRPSKTGGQWPVVMPTWSSEYGGPLRADQVEHIANYVMNWEESALAQSEEEDPWIPFQDTPERAGGDAATDVNATDAEMTDESAGTRAPADLFTSLGCTACHMLDMPQTPENRGAVGPNLGNLHETAATRVEGQDAESYVYNSITNPNTHVVEGYVANIMPPNLAEKMTEEEMSGLVEWLLDPNKTQ